MSMRAEDALSTIGILWLRSRALRAIREQGRGSHEVDSLEQAIDTIGWERTEEGGAFWGRVWSWACGRPRPELKKERLSSVEVPDEPIVTVAPFDALRMIPNGIGDLAVRRAEEFGRSNTEPGHHTMSWVSAAFMFSTTPEGWEFWNAVSKWTGGEGDLPDAPTPTHPELGEVEVVERGETYSKVRTADGSTRFVRSDEMYEG